jgi:hypothetical protein
MSDTVERGFENWKDKQYFEPCGRIFYLCFEGGYEAAQAEAKGNIRIAELRMKIAIMASKAFATENERYMAERADVGALMGELAGFASHDDGCSVNRYVVTQECDCGYNKALTKAQAFMEGKL